MSSRFCSNSEAYASKLLQNLDEIIPWYYVDIEYIQSHIGVLPVAKEVIINIWLSSNPEEFAFNNIRLKNIENKFHTEVTKKPSCEEDDIWLTC